MIKKCTIVGVGDVQTINNEKRTKMQTICVEVPHKRFDGVYCLITNIFNDRVGTFSINDEVLCEIGDYGTKLISVIPFNEVL